MKLFTLLSLSLAFLILSSNLLFSQCGIVSQSTFSATSVDNMDGTCTWTIEFVVTNNSGNGNAGLSYSLEADDLGNGTMTTINPDDGVCDETGVSAPGRTVTNTYTGSCDVLFNLEWTGYASPQCNGNTCESGSETTSEPAPVELVEFQGQALSREVLLTFSTRSEENNNYFEIERSRNSQNPQTIGMVEGNGTTQDYIRYTFKDSQPLPQAYYRLKQVDYNGDFEYSDWIFVKLDEVDNTNEIKVYPTISNSNINIIFSTAVNQKSILMISDLSGNKIYSESFLGSNGINNYLTYNVEGLIPGIYIVQLSTGIQSSYTKFIITK